MAQSYAQLQKQIAQLQRAADALRDKEVAGVVSRIKEAIAHYGLTAAQLGYGVSPKRSAAPSVKARSGARGGAKFGDGTGRFWGGRGPRPAWLRDAIASGKRLENFRIEPAPAVRNVQTEVGSVAKSSRKGKKQTRRPSSVLYRDDAGNSWTGRGPQPRWLKDAVAGGKTLEQLMG